MIPAAKKENKVERSSVSLSAIFRYNFCDYNFPIISRNSVRQVISQPNTSIAILFFRKFHSRSAIKRGFSVRAKYRSYFKFPSKLYVRLSVQYLITQQFPASGPIPRAEVAPRRAHHPIHTLVRNTSRRTSERLDIDFRFQFNAVTISQARSSNTNFVLSDFSCDVPVPCSSNASRARDTRGRASRQSRETRKASRRLMNILDDNYIDISVDFQCRRT